MIAINTVWLGDTKLQHFIKHHLDWNESLKKKMYLNDCNLHLVSYTPRTHFSPSVLSLG